jgi:hypothetical protein
MEARNRKLSDWYGKVQRAEIKLPRFQRFEAWDRNRICSLVETVINNLPLGITLVLDVGEKEKFIARYLSTAPEVDGRVYEQLLDGQQRLTALWRVFQNNYEWETYYIYLKALDEYDGDAEMDDHTVYWRGRYYKKSGERYPLWCDDPAKTLHRGFIPTDLLRPEDIQGEIDVWIKHALAPIQAQPGDSSGIEAYYQKKQQVSDAIKDLRAVIANYNLPYLSLPANTGKSVALNVFINMNTNSKPLSTYDIIVAEVESVMGRSLHDLVEGLVTKSPEVADYKETSKLILNTAALLQNQLPNQRGAWDMDKRQMVNQWDTLERGLQRMARFLQSEGIFDESRLPTNAVLAVIAALYRDIPESGDKLGQDELLLKRYLWNAFFTDRYENAAATHAFSDFNALKRIVCGDKKADGAPYGVSDVPIFAEHAMVEAEELMTAEWPKRASIRGRGVLAVACRLGALDFSTGERLDKNNIGSRHYHHIFPDALLKEADIDSYLALNCALITDKTNITIGRKDPLIYLKDRYQWTTESIINERLQSHLIPISELSNGGYEGLTDEEKKAKLAEDFRAFLAARAKLVCEAAKRLADGHQLSAAEFYSHA